MLNNKIKTVTAYFGEELIEWGKTTEHYGNDDDDEEPESTFTRDDTGYQADVELFDSGSQLNSSTLGEDDPLAGAYEPSNVETFG